MKRELMVVIVVLAAVILILAITSVFPLTGNATYSSIATGGISCVDTDGDFTFKGSTYVEGVVTAEDAVGNVRTFSDDCPSGRKMQEFYCNQNARPASKTVICADGCDRNACIR
jgi:hypothetical protein